MIVEFTGVSAVVAGIIHQIGGLDLVVKFCPVVAILFVGAYLFGLFDRPDFVHKDKIVENVGDGGGDILLFVVPSNKKPISDYICEIYDGMSKALKAVPSEEYLEEAARLYGISDKKLQLAIFFDNPNKTDEPRWAAGWVLVTNSPQKTNELLQKMNEACPLEDPIRVATLTNRSNFRARIPWRHDLTPLMAAILHWPRAFAALKKYCQTTTKKQDNFPVSVEFYILGNGKSPCIDYILLEDGKDLLEQLFPSMATTSAW